MRGELRYLGVAGGTAADRVGFEAFEHGTSQRAALDDWDARAVDARGGHVLQSRAWAEHRTESGWQPRFLAASTPISSPPGRPPIPSSG